MVGCPSRNRVFGAAAPSGIPRVGQNSVISVGKPGYSVVVIRSFNQVAEDGAVYKNKVGRESAHTGTEKESCGSRLLTDKAEHMCSNPTQALSEFPSTGTDEWLAVQEAIHHRGLWK